MPRIAANCPIGKDFEREALFELNLLGNDTPTVYYPNPAYNTHEGFAQHINREILYDKMTIVRQRYEITSADDCPDDIWNMALQEVLAFGEWPSDTLVALYDTSGAGRPNTVVKWACVDKIMRLRFQKKVPGPERCAEIGMTFIPPVRRETMMNREVLIFYVDGSNANGASLVSTHSCYTSVGQRTDSLERNRFCL